MIDRTYRDDPYEYMSQDPCDYCPHQNTDGGMIDLCEGCKHKDSICFVLEFPCLNYEPKDEDEEEEGEEK